jgi:hypothetical protein
MAQTIYKVWLVKPTEAWHQLSHEEQDKLFAQVAEARAKVGGTIPIACQSGWASEQWPFWGVDQFPDIEANQKFTELLNAFNWFRYMESLTVLGTEMPSS